MIEGAREPDDDASLAWDGDDAVATSGRATSASPTPASPTPTSLPPHVDTALREAARPEASPSETSSSDSAAPARSTPAIVLITFGILAGAYLIYTIGWVGTVQRSTTVLPNQFGDLMFRAGQYLAIASPAIWFGAVFALTRRNRAVVRLLWLVLGLAVVTPWPFVLGV